MTEGGVLAGTYPAYVTSFDLATPYAIGSSNFTFQQKVTALTQAIGGTIDLMTMGMGLSTAQRSFDFANTLTNPRDGMAQFAYQQQGRASLSSAGTSGAYGVAQIGNAINTAITPTIQSVGGIGGFSARGLTTDSYIISVSYKAVDNANYRAMYGWPVFRVDTPQEKTATTSGYCQTIGYTAENITANLTIKNDICAYMDSGVFIE